MTWFEKKSRASYLRSRREGSDPSWEPPLLYGAEFIQRKIDESRAGKEAKCNQAIPYRFARYRLLVV